MRPPRPFSAIAAISLNNVIGNNNQLPWKIPADLKWFKQLTMGHILVMGRKTFASIGRPLPGRITVVLSRTQIHIQNVQVVSSIADIPLVEGKKSFICGGGELYAQTSHLWSELYLSRINQIVQGDAYFPDIMGQFIEHEILEETAEFKISRYLPHDIDSAKF